MSGTKDKHIIIPCSGIGKAVGTVARRAAYIVTDETLPDKAVTMCLPLLTIEDSEAIEKIRRNPCITIEGCIAECARKNVEYHKGQLKADINVLDVLRQNNRLKPGTVLDIGPDGEKLAKKVAEKIVNAIEDSK
jgi:uncharacterized metal-binding protein